MESEYWETRYREKTTGWDIGTISTPIKTYIDQLNDKGLKILIPGGGNSYEAEYLFSKGFRNVYVNDFAEQPLVNLKERAPEIPDSHLLLEDFFNLKVTFELIIEQTFFCALPPEKRPAYVAKVHELLVPQGKLIGVLFSKPFDKEGPPFGGTYNEYVDLFQDKFHIKLLEPCYNSIPPRQGNELFFIFIKK